RRKSQARRRDGTEWTVSLELCAQAMMKGNGIDPVVVDDVLDTARALLRGPNAEGATPWRTLRDLDQGELTLQEMGGLATKLEDLARVEPRLVEPSQDEPGDAQPPTQLVLRSVASRHTRSLIDTYNGMVADWVTPLSPVLLERHRLAREQLVREAALDVTLASRVIGAPAPEPPTQSEPPEASQQSWNLPVRAGPSSSQVHDSQASQPLVLPTPSPTATPSITTASSRPMSFAAPEIARLSRYTAFSKPAPADLPRSLNRVLTHWSVGTDPAIYDWQATSRRVAEREDVVDEEMTEKERARLQRRTERHIKRQRREVAASQAAQQASSQALHIVHASQPAPPTNVESQRGAGEGASQSQTLGVGPASQVVPGRYGGRPSKKKRKQGF
ncbi:hypothetical protein LTR53_017461, partial [Teratosphaeriaceae sp. CCFEE 6253]